MISMPLFTVTQSPPVRSMNCLEKSKLILDLQIAVMKHCNIALIFFNKKISSQGENVTRVKFDGGCFMSDFRIQGNPSFLYTEHPHLEGVSIACMMLHSGLFSSLQHIPQLLLKCVCRWNRSLRWIQCNLKCENLAELQLEHSKVTSVSSYVEI